MTEEDFIEALRSLLQQASAAGLDTDTIGELTDYVLENGWE